MNKKREEMMAFWTERAKRFGIDPQANTNDIWLRDIEIRCVNHVINLHTPEYILDFACANGYSTLRLAGANPGCFFLGIDINHDMIRSAIDSAQAKGYPNVEFRQADIILENMEERFDLVYVIRGFQNLESCEKQKRVVDRLYDILNEKGFLYYIESYQDGYSRLNEDRERLNLPPLPIHSHLTLLTGRFDDYVSAKMKLLERSSPSSSYYLITRLLYSYISMMNGEAIDYNHPIHQVAAIVPQIGEYGPQQAALYQKQ